MLLGEWWSMIHCHDNCFSFIQSGKGRLAVVVGGTPPEIKCAVLSIKWRGIFCLKVLFNWHSGSWCWRLERSEIERLIKLAVLSHRTSGSWERTQAPLGWPPSLANETREREHVIKQTISDIFPQSSSDITRYLSPCTYYRLSRKDVCARGSTRRNADDPAYAETLQETSLKLRHYVCKNSTLKTFGKTRKQGMGLHV